MSHFNLVIFRIPDEDGESTLVELDYVAGALAEVGTKFTVHPGDEYETLPFNKLVLAEKTLDGSRSLFVYDIVDSATNFEAIIHELDGEQLAQLVHFFAEEVKSGRAKIMQDAATAEAYPESGRVLH